MSQINVFIAEISGFLNESALYYVILRFYGVPNCHCGRIAEIKMWDAYADKGCVDKSLACEHMFYDKFGVCMVCDFGIICKRQYAQIRCSWCGEYWKNIPSEW